MIADQHYMVPIDRQVNEAARMVEDNLYFCINRGRQYGKTTTLAFLKQKLEVKGYVVFSISFEGLPDSAYESLETLIYASLEKMVFSMQLNTIANFSNESAQLLLDLQNRNKKYTDVQDFVATIAAICSKERLVLLIDEVDQAGNYPSFVKFLGVLREMYLRRDEIPTFYSVILAGVYDIKNLKLKMRPEDQHQYNSPWNIAAPFDTDMSLHADGIAVMLSEYKEDHQLDFDVKDIAQVIYDYTSGYPFLVSRICLIMDENKLPWNRNGVLNAVNSLLKEGNTLFDDMAKILNQFPKMSQILHAILYQGLRVAYK